MGAFERTFAEIKNVDDVARAREGNKKNTDIYKKKAKNALTLSCARATTSTNWVETDQNVDNVDSLPTECPIRTGHTPSYVATRCRFEPTLLRRLISESTVKPEAGCPIATACGLMCSWPRVVQNGGSNGRGEATVRCLGYDCEHVSYRFEEGIDRANAPMLWCGQADSAVIDLGGCPRGRWEKDERGWPVDLEVRS